MGTESWKDCRRQSVSQERKGGSGAASMAARILS